MKTVLAGTDASAGATMAVVEAAELARSREAELVVLYVRPPLDAREVFRPDELPDVDEHFEDLRRRLAGTSMETRKAAGDPAEVICDTAKELPADVIVVGSRGTRGRTRWFLGSVPNAVIQHSPCSVYVVDTRGADRTGGS